MNDESEQVLSLSLTSSFFIAVTYTFIKRIQVYLPLQMKKKEVKL